MNLEVKSMKNDNSLYLYNVHLTVVANNFNNTVVVCK